MAFERDPRKAAANFKKHGVRLSDAVAVLEDERARTLADEAAGEQRWITLGMDALGRLLVVVYCYRGADIRIISARPANRSEQRQYRENS